MPWVYDIDEQRGVLLVRAFGRLDDEELLTGYRTAMQDPRYHPDMRVLGDYDGITDNRVTVETVAHLAATRLHAPKARRAAFASSPLGFGMLRMFEQYSENLYPESIRVFRTRDEAVAWLNEGVPTEQQLT